MTGKRDQSPAIGGLGGTRITGQRSERSEAALRANEEAIKSSWRIARVEDAFPNSIKPTSLGMSATQNLRRIASLIDLPTAQTTFLATCRKGDGSPTPFAHSHSLKILDTLKLDETSTSTSTPTAPKVNTKDVGTKSKPASVGKNTASNPDGPSAKDASVVPLRTPKRNFSNPDAPAAKKARTDVNLVDPFGRDRTPPAAAVLDNTSSLESIPLSKSKPNISLGPPQLSAIAPKEKSLALPPQMVRSQIFPSTPIDKTKGAQSASNNITAIPSIDEDDLERRVAENSRANAALISGSTARQAVFNKDFIRVKTASGSRSDIQTTDVLRKHCLELHETFGNVRPSQTCLYKMARSDQAHLVQQVTRLLDRGLHTLKLEMEAIFAENKPT